MTGQPYVTVQEAVRRLGVHKALVYRAIRDGHSPHGDIKQRILRVPVAALHFDAPAPTPANRAASDLEPTGRGGEVRSRSSRTSKIKSMRAARQAKHELLAAAQGGKLATPSKITIEALPDQWLNSKQRLARKTRDDYARHVRLHIVPLLGAMRLHELTPAKLSAFYSELSKQGKGTPTQQKVHVVLWCCTAR